MRLLFLTLVVPFAGLGLGTLSHWLWRPRAPWFGGEDTPLENLVLDISIGMGFVSVWIYAWGVAQLWPETYVSMGMFTVFGAWICIGRLRAAGKGGSLRVRREMLLPLALLLIVAVAALVPALAPPSMSDWDSLAYHLSVPKLWIQHGGIHYINFTSHSNFPMLVEMLYEPGLAMGSPVAGKMVHYLMGVLLVAAVYVLTKRHFSEKAAPLAAIAVVGMPIVLWEATTAYIDLATALYTVICAHLLLNYFDTGHRSYLIGCAISAGFGASTKMTGLALIPLLAIWLVVDALVASVAERPKPPPKEAQLPLLGERVGVRARCAVILAAVALLVCSPWYIKSWVYTGNPVYPFFYSIFGGKDWTAELASNYSMLQAKFGLGHDFASFLQLPFGLTFNSWAFYDTPGLFVGPILLIAAPLLFVVRYPSRKLAGLTAFFVAQMLIWFALTQQSRYLIPAFAVLAVVVASAVYLDSCLRLVRTALWAAFTGAALFGVYTLWPAVVSAAPYLFGSETRSQYLTRTLDIYPAQEWMNEHLPKSAEVALYGDTRGFYLDRDYVWADPGHNTLFTRDFGSVPGMIRYLKKLGVTHTMVNLRFFPSPEKAKGPQKLVYEAIEEGLFEQVYPVGDDSRRVFVFKIR